MTTAFYLSRWHLYSPQFPERLLRTDAAIDREGVAGDVPGRVGHQPHHGVGTFALQQPFGGFGAVHPIAMRNLDGNEPLQLPVMSEVDEAIRGVSLEGRTSL